ncbi:MAG: cysteine desulfurase, partial [Chlorobium sp.]
GTRPELPGKSPSPVWPTGNPETLGASPLPFSIPGGSAEHYYFLREPQQPIHQPEGFNVATIRKDFPVLHQKVHGKPLVWFDNAATTQKPLSVINAMAQFYATDNSNIHRGAHTLAARATDAYEGAREKIRQFIGAGSTSEIIYVRGTTEGINLVAQTWGRKFLQPGDEIVLSILEHHANIVPWQMVAQEKGARIKVVPVNDRGEIILEEYTKLLGPRTRLVSLTQASNGLGTILPVKEMIKLAKRYDARVLVDGAQSVAHIPINVQDLDADFFVFSGHKIFAPTGIGVVYGKKELLEVMPPWQGGGNMIKDVRFEETIYNEAPAKFEAGTPSIGDAIGLGAALDYVRKIGLDNIARYEHELTEYGTGQLVRIPGLRLIGTAQNKVGVLSFVLNNLPNDEVGKLLDREGIAVRTGHHCSQPSLRRFGVEGTVRPSLAFYNTREEIDRLADVINHIQRR